jgi:Tol biopolymer transport system component
MAFHPAGSPRSIRLWTAALAVAAAALAAGCRHLVFSSDRSGHDQLYRMRTGGGSPGTTALPAPDGQARAYPAVSPGRDQLAYVRGGTEVVVRDLAGAGPERVVASGPGAKRWPRWSCGRERIAYAERTDGQSDARLLVVRADGTGEPVLVASPGTYGGHTWAFDGKLLIYSAVPHGSSRLALIAVAADGSLAPAPLMGSAVSSEELPTLSHRGDLLAWLHALPTAPETWRTVKVVDSRTFAARHELTLPQAQGTGAIGAIGFWGDDGGLYLGMAPAAPPAPSTPDRHELFSVKLDGSGLEQLTSNQAYDSQGDGIPDHPSSSCRACALVAATPETGPSTTLAIGGLVFEAATLPSGAVSPLAVTDYCPHDGLREVKVPWSQSSAGGASHASLQFPQAVFGAGPASVELTGCHYDSLRLAAYDRSGAALSTVTHSAGQGKLEVLALGGGRIARVDVVGAEIGIREVCWSP